MVIGNFLRVWQMSRNHGLDETPLLTITNLAACNYSGGYLSHDRLEITEHSPIAATGLEALLPTAKHDLISGMLLVKVNSLNCNKSTMVFRDARRIYVYLYFCWGPRYYSWFKLCPGCKNITTATDGPKIIDPVKDLYIVVWWSAFVHLLLTTCGSNPVEMQNNRWQWPSLMPAPNIELKPFPPKSSCGWEFQNFMSWHTLHATLQVG